METKTTKMDYFGNKTEDILFDYQGSVSTPVFGKDTQKQCSMHFYSSNYSRRRQAYSTYVGSITIAIIPYLLPPWLQVSQS